MHLEQIPNVLVSSFVLGMLYSMVALGFVLLMRSAGVFNFATGQIIMLGAFLYYELTVVYDLPFVVAIIGVLLTMAILGALVHYALLKQLAGLEHWSYAVLTLGVSIVLARVLAMIWGTEPRTISLPVPNLTVTAPDQIAISTGGIVTIIAAMVMLVGMVLIIRYSKWGIQMRAAAENPVLASQRGIDIDRVFMLGWAATCIVLTTAGIAYAYTTILSQELGGIGVRGFAPAFVGGMDSVVGVFPGSMVVALAENLAALYLGESARDAAVMMVVLIVLVIKPTGLFGTPRVRRI